MSRENHYSSNEPRRLRPFLRKPLWVVARQEYEGISQGPSTQSPGVGNDSYQPHLPRHLSLFDLVSVGVGGTIGSGVFVLCGLIAKEYAGPATCVSWAIAGLAAFLSGF
mmetsp:Transcript_16270/g.25309  ORF Transcript_16270/g.25309 Transcript_16270/m.25309 type:complete len:109 (+) Transcript_16270:66-392(+)